MSVAPAWPLTRSSELALDWAALFSGMRGAGEVDSIDLLLGLMFAHPTDSEPLQLLDHFRIPGSALSDAIARTHPGHRITPTSEIPAAPPRRSPDTELGRDVEAVLGRASELAERFGADQKLARVKDVFGAMLMQTDAPVARAIADLLETRYVSYGLTRLAPDYEEFLKSGGSEPYAAFLAARTPFTPPVLALPRYDADMVSPDARGEDPDRPLIPDLVDIGGEVDAFAHLLAAKDLQPPLAIGLFGDWGSGKSFFMRELQRRIYQITGRARTSGRPQRDLPIYKSVAQIEFNAWHYVEGNLWASLVDHIFQNLRTSAGDSEADLVERRQQLAEQVASTERARAQVTREIDQLTKSRDLVRAEEEALRDQKREAIQAAAAVGPVTRRVLAEVRNEPRVKVALQRLGLDQAFASAEELRAAVVDARSTVQSGAGVIGRLRTEDPTRIAVLALAAVAAVVGVSLLLFAAGIDGVRNLVASATTLLAVAGAFVRQSSQWMQERLADVERIEGALREAERADHLEQAEAAREIEQLDARLAAAREQATELDARVADLRRSLDELSPGQLLARFIDRRAESDDYRRFLGVPAIVRQDFEQLWRRLDAENRQFVARDDGRAEPPKHAVNRIVLYIDDLDRCPPAVVVKVLQAVHLLLAFPLFVVVVAVDARWLANALEQHYAHLLSSRADRTATNGSGPAAPSAGQATPDDYLEKIFQIPFRIRPLDDAARLRIIEGLIAPSLAVDGRPGAGGGEGEPNRPMDPALLRQTQRRIFGRDGGDAGIDPSSLRILPHELEFMKALSPIVGDSPRAVKRFVNVYRLLKALEEPRDSSFAANRPFAPYQQVMFLLAVVTGLPDISARLCSEIRHPVGGRHQLRQIAEAIRAESHGPEERSQADAVVRWLDQGAVMGGVWGTATVTSLATWVEPIARFSFGSEVRDVRPGAALPPPPAPAPRPRASARRRVRAPA